MTLLLAATPERRAVARAAVRDNIRRLGVLGQRNLVEILRDLQRSRDRLVAMLAEGTEFDQTRARAMLPAVDAEARRIRDALGPKFADVYRASLTLGDADALAQARTVLPADTRLSQGVSLNLVDMATTRSADLVGQIGEATRAAINDALRRGAVGSSRPADVARAIGSVLGPEGRPTGVFGTLATQVERVHRTETAGLYEAASKARTVQVERESPFEMQEVWVALNDGRARPEHLDMNGATIRVGEHFNFGAGPTWSKVSYEEAGRQGGTQGTAVMGPHDSVLPASQAVH